MNATQPGYWMGALLGAAGVGAIAGLIPLFFGVRKNKTWLAIGGFLASVTGGLTAGAVGALLLAGIFSLLIRPWDQPAMVLTQATAGGSTRGDCARVVSCRHVHHANRDHGRRLVTRDVFLAGEELREHTDSRGCRIGSHVRDHDDGVHGRGASARRREVFLFLTRRISWLGWSVQPGRFAIA